MERLTLVIGVKTNLFENKYLSDDITYLRYFGTEDIASTSIKEIEIHEFFYHKRN